MASSSSSSNEWLFSEKLLRDSCQLPWEKQMEILFKTIWFLEDIGKYLKCNRRIVSTASVYFHRFFVFHSFYTNDRFDVALACLFLASKVEEWPVKLDILISARFSLRSPNPPSDMEFKELMKNVLIKERILLQTLNFDLIVQQPYEFIWNKIKELKNRVPERENRDRLHQTSLQFVNDSYRSTIFLEFPANQVGIAAIFLAGLQLDLCPAKSDPRNSLAQSWFDIFDGDIDEEALRALCTRVLDTYTRASKSLYSQVKSFPRIEKFGQLSDTHPIELKKPSDISSTATDESASKMEQSPHIGSVVSPAGGGASPTGSNGSGAMTSEVSYDDQELSEKQRKVTVTTFLKSTSGAQQQRIGAAASESPFNIPFSQHNTAPNDSPASSTYSTFSNINNDKGGVGNGTAGLNDVGEGEDTPVHFPPLQNSFSSVPVSSSNTADSRSGGSSSASRPAHMQDEQHWSKKIRTG